MFAKIETDSGDMLNVHYGDGRFGGNAVLSFVIGLHLYCEKDMTDDLQWFSALETFTTIPICSLCQPLLKSFNHNGDWSIFKEDEYEFFQKRYPDFLMTESEFRHMVREMEQKWVETRILLTTIEKIINILRQETLTKVPSFDPLLIADDFQALYETLTILAERNADRVRILFI